MGKLQGESSAKGRQEHIMEKGGSTSGKAGNGCYRGCGEIH